MQSGAGYVTLGGSRYTPLVHLRVLLRLERSSAIKSAIEAAVTKAASVFDAGCGSGILSIMAAVVVGRGEFHLDAFSS